LGTGDLWLLEFGRGVSTRFTFTQQGTNDDPVWSPDGRYVVFDSNRNGKYDLYRKASNGTGEDEILLQSDQDKVPTSFSHDGRFLLYDSADAKTAENIWVLPLDGERKPIPFLHTEFVESSGAFSPDGHWIAYLSNENGVPEIFVRPFNPPGTGAPGAGAGKWQVSKGGSAGRTPFWRADGKELYYRSPSGALMAVDVSGGPAFQPGTPHRLFDALAGYSLEPAADGKRFLVSLPQQDSGPQAITIVLNWEAGLKK
jgi:Tol biopolymer transport system component